jgi:phosphate transport system permease protein
MSILLLMLLMVYEIGFKSLPAVREYGIGFLSGTTWDNSKQQYGILPEIWGTLYSSLLALVLAGVFGLSIAIWLTQDFLPDKLAYIIKTIVDLLAAIPSVVYGLWGIYVIIPMLRPVSRLLHEYLGWIPLFGTALSGPGMLPAALVLAIMILPTVTAISRDALSSVPMKLREASFGLGATRWETIRKLVIPAASRGIWAALVLGLGRALGETMALAMLVGNSNQLSISLFSPGNTLAALLANQFPEAGPKDGPVLLYAAVVLLLITLFVNMIGSWALWKATARGEAGQR